MGQGVGKGGGEGGGGGFSCAGLHFLCNPRPPVSERTAHLGLEVFPCLSAGTSWPAPEQIKLTGYSLDSFSQTLLMRRTLVRVQAGVHMLHAD